MMKHAYLILAHNEFDVLARLLRAIDDERNDIYVHFDRKLRTLPECLVSRAGLHVLKDRVDVRWGDRSVVEAELRLFRAAFGHGGYSYFHLLSGVDMPLKSQDYIYEFMEDNAGKEFIGYYQDDASAGIDRKVRLWHLFSGDFKNRSFVKRILRAAFLRLQLLAGFRRNRRVNFRKGTQWVSLTGDFVGYLLAREEEIKRIYSHTFCADEIFVQTACWNSPFRGNIYDAEDEAHGCMRMIGWENNRIREWEEEDYDALMASGVLFARKFTGKHIGLVDKILDRII